MKCLEERKEVITKRGERSGNTSNTQRQCGLWRKAQLVLLYSSNSDMGHSVFFTAPFPHKLPTFSYSLFWDVKCDSWLALLFTGVGSVEFSVLRQLKSITLPPWFLQEKILIHEPPSRNIVVSLLPPQFEPHTATPPSLCTYLLCTTFRSLIKSLENEKFILCIYLKYSLSVLFSNYLLWGKVTEKW